MSSAKDKDKVQHPAQNSQNIATDNDVDSDDESLAFYDACSEPNDFRTIPMDLDCALKEAKLAISYFFNNSFDEARDILKPYTESSMYHSMGYAVFLFLEAILTFEPQHITLAGEELKKCLSICQHHRRKCTITQTIGNKFRRADYSQLTDLESHAELCFAEALLLKALVAFIEDETLTSLVQGGLKIRYCYNSYKECVEILKQRKWQTKISKVHFESGVRMGMGTFNLMISLLPTSVGKVLEFAGLSGNKLMGLEDLRIGYKLPGLRQNLCAMTLLGFNLIVSHMLSHKEGDLQLCQEILTERLKQYPNGVWFLFFKGRLEFLNGNLDEAQKWYKKSWKSQNVWTQFHHLSFWELLWVNCLKLDWRESNLYATYLLEKSKWSRTIYSYQKASLMLMQDNNTELERRITDNLMHDVPKYKQRIAGKSLPMEKFLCKKAERYFEQNRELCLPAIELMYVWNIFKVLAKSFQIAVSIHGIIEQKMDQINKKHTTDPFYIDDHALCLLLRGACYRQMKKAYLALQDFEACIALKNNIKYDTYLAPYACVEAALTYADEGRIELAVDKLEEAKKKYTGYSLESRLNFRIHAAISELQELQKK